jgi:regulator of telomere elongation helicase 1
MVPFPVQLSNPHIIGDNQLFAGVFKVGPGEVRLSSSFQNRNDTSYLKSLGELIVKVCSVVPKGVLVFFPSYSVMDLCSKAWQANGIWESIAAHKVRPL